MAIDMNRGTQGVALPAEISDEIWSETIESSAVMGAARRIPLPGSGVTLPIITGDAEASWVEETDPIEVSRPTLANKTIRGYKLAVIVPFSNEFKRDLESLYGELVNRLPGSLAKKFDETVSGAHAKPGDLFDQLDTAPALTIAPATAFKDMAAVLAAISAQGRELTHWISNPALHGQLLTATDALGRPFFISDPAAQKTVGSVFGAPVQRTRANLGAGNLGLAGDFANSAVYGTVQGVQVSLSDQATLKDGDQSINLWQQDMFAVKAQIEVGFRVRNTQHFARLRSA